MINDVSNELKHKDTISLAKHKTTSACCRMRITFFDFVFIENFSFLFLKKKEKKQNNLTFLSLPPSPPPPRLRRRLLSIYPIENK